MVYIPSIRRSTVIDLVALINPLSFVFVADFANAQEDRLKVSQNPVGDIVTIKRRARQPVRPSSAHSPG